MQEKIDARLLALVGNCQEASLREAMLYSISAGGKRLRPMLLLAACEAVSGTYGQNVLDFACALEMIHTYSLIHDDLPAMDNDDFRRGKPSSHIKFGESMAILAGDALLNRAFETMAGACADISSYEEDSGSHSKMSYLRNAEAMLIIAAAAGDNGMIAGQVCDIHFQNKKLDADTLFNIHSRKAGALFAAALEAGAVLGGASLVNVQAMKQAGAKMGWAFQILDDLLDVTATQEELGKPVNSDSRNQKNTYVSVHGLEAAKADYARISAEVLADFNRLPQKTETLRDIVQQAIDRKN